MRRVLPVVAAVAAVAQLPDLKTPRLAPEQPIPFSHKLHASQGIACQQCHPMPDPGDFATIAKPPVCMACHNTVKKDSPHIRKLAAFHAESKRVPWAPVYRIPDWVLFSHRKHLGASGVQCEDCHGPVREREVLRREKDLSMAACMDCHRAKGASNDCLFCHDQK
jgi:hypothetical protein